MKAGDARPRNALLAPESCPPVLGDANGAEGLKDKQEVKEQVQRQRAAGGRAEWRGGASEVERASLVFCGAGARRLLHAPAALPPHLHLLLRLTIHGLPFHLSAAPSPSCLRRAALTSSFNSCRGANPWLSLVTHLPCHCAHSQVGPPHLYVFLQHSFHQQFLHVEKTELDVKKSVRNTSEQGF